jgi:hypothetical protein
MLKLRLHGFGNIGYCRKEERMRGMVKAVAAVFVCWLALSGVVWAAPQLSISQDWQQYNPYGVEPGETLTKHCWLKNVGDAELVTSISIDSLYPSTQMWFTLSSLGPFTIQPGDSVQVTLSVLGVGSPGTLIRQFAGFWFVSNTPTPNDSLYDSITADSPPSHNWAPLIDTISTGCTRLVIDDGLEMGDMGSGRANMDYFDFGDCDTSDAILGQSDVYLFDGSPVILRKTGDAAYTASWDMFGEGVGGPNGFRPQVDAVPPIFRYLDTVTAEYEMLQSGQWMTNDSLVAIEVTYYAPRNAGDSCNFIIRKMALFPTHSTAVTNLMIGDAIDWDIPSDTAVYNRGGFDAGRNLLYQRGWDKASDPTQCQRNDARFGGTALLNWHLASEGPLAGHTTLYGGLVGLNSDWIYPNDGFVPSELWNLLSIPGLTNVPDSVDLFTLLSYKYNFTLASTDTLIVWSAVATIRNGSLADLQSTMDKAKRWFFNHLSGFPPPCCVGTTGDANGDGTVDIGDLDCQIQFIFFGFLPPDCCVCPEECDFNGDRANDISDIVTLVDFLFFGGELPPCPML